MSRHFICLALPVCESLVSRQAERWLVWPEAAAPWVSEGSERPAGQCRPHEPLWAWTVFESSREPLCDPKESQDLVCTRRDRTGGTVGAGHCRQSPLLHFRPSGGGDMSSSVKCRGPGGRGQTGRRQSLCYFPFATGKSEASGTREGWEEQVKAASATWS